MRWYARESSESCINEEAFELDLEYILANQNIEGKGLLGEWKQHVFFREDSLGCEVGRLIASCGGKVHW